MPKIKRQKQQVIEAIEQAEGNDGLIIARVHLCEKMLTQVCVELLAYGLMILGDGNNTYRICTTPDADVKGYLGKAKAEI